MEVGLVGVRFLFSPYATAFAAGALFAFCVALLKKRYRPKKRRDSAPESTCRIAEPEFQESKSASLAKYNSVGSLCSNSRILDDLDLKSLSTISNFQAFDGGQTFRRTLDDLPVKPISNFQAFDGGRISSSTLDHKFQAFDGRSSPFGRISRFRPFTFSDDLVNLERRFIRSNQQESFGSRRLGHSCSLPNFLVSRSKGRIFGSVYPQFQTLGGRHRTQFVDLYSSRSFQGRRRSISLEYPEVPVVYQARDFCASDHRDVCTSDHLISRAAVQKNETSIRNRKHTTSFLKDSELKWISNVPKKTHRYVDFRSSSVALLEYLCSNRRCYFPENDAKESVAHSNSDQHLSIRPCAVEYLKTRKNKDCGGKDENGQDSFAVINKDVSEGPNETESNDFNPGSACSPDDSDAKRFSGPIVTKQIAESLTSNTVLESYIQVINCAKDLAELTKSDFSVAPNFEKEIKFLKSQWNNTLVNGQPESATMDQAIFIKEETVDDENFSLKSYTLVKNNNRSESAAMDKNNSITEETVDSENFSAAANVSNCAKASTDGSIKETSQKSEESVENFFATGDIGNSAKASKDTSAREEFTPEESPKFGLPKNSTALERSEKESVPPATRHCQAAESTTNDIPASDKCELLLSLSLRPIHDVRGVVGKADDPKERRQMDRGTRDRTVDGWKTVCAPSRVFESNISSETRVDGVVVSSVSVNGSDVWTEVVDTCSSNGVDMSVRTVISTDQKDISSQDFKPMELRANGTQKHVSCDTRGSSPNPSTHFRPQTSTPQPYRPNFEEYMVERGPDETSKELDEIAGRPLVLEEFSPPRVTRLLGLLSRDEERRARAQLLSEKRGEEIDGEWDRILRDVLASVSELERYGDARKRFGDVGDARKRFVENEEGRTDDVSELARFGDASRRFGENGGTDAEDDLPHQSSSGAMEGEGDQRKEETPTKVKSLRFKLDPDIFDVPSDDSFYDDENDDDLRRGGNWRRQQTKYKAFHTLELGDEPVQLVSVHASVVPAGQKMVARPVGIDLRVRLTEERGKRAHVGTSPLQQAKRRSPVSDTRVGWCQELSPVTENVDWRETFTSVPKENNGEVKPVPNGILKTPSPKAEVVVKDSSNPFKEDGVVKTVESKPKTNGMTPWNPPQKKFSLPRKKFEPDPEAVDRITGYKTALSKPPLPPPPVFQKITLTARNRADIARKQYLDQNKAALSASNKADGSRKFQQFLAQAQSDRARIVTSVPDLGAIERAVHEKWNKERGSASPRASPAREEAQKVVDTPSSRGSTPDDAWSSYVQTCRKHLGRRSQSMTYLETDVDLVPLEDEEKWRSTSDLNQPVLVDHPIPIEDSDLEQSREDLDDSGRAKSEHELRIQKSLQSLPLPDWYKRSDKPKTGFLLKSSDKEKRGWAAAKSLASSTSSLASCGIKRPIHSLRSSRENIPWSRSSPSPDGPALSLALSKAFREPYLGWRARTSTTSSGVSSSPPSSWCAATTDEEANGISFDGEDAFGRTSSEGRRDETDSPDDTGADAVTVSMDTGDLVKLPGGEDTCEDINNMSMDTCEIFDPGFVHEDPSIILGETSPQADTGDDIDNLSTDTTEDKRKNLSTDTTTESRRINSSEDKRKTLSTDTTTESKRINSSEDKRKNLSTDTTTDNRRINSSEDTTTTTEDRRKKDPKSKRYSYSQSIYNSEWEDDEESRGDRKVGRDPSPTSPDSKVIWIESSFVGSRTTTSIVVLPEGRESKVEGDCIERPASR